MAQSAEQARLRRILNDEHYGPALVRLTKAEQRRVLDLIEQNRGAEARKLIDELDRKRKDKALPNGKIVAHEAQQLGKVPVDYSLTTLAKGPSKMSMGEKRETMLMNGQDIRDYAGNAGNIRDGWNPWWYRK